MSASEGPTENPVKRDDPPENPPIPTAEAKSGEAEEGEAGAGANANEAEAGEGTGPESDLAAESLERALALSFALLRAVLVLLLVLFFSECFRFVDEGTIAVKTRFGRFLRDDQGRVIVYRPESRFVLVLPFPIEELKVLPLGTETLRVDATFWPKVSAVEAVNSKSAIPARAKLDPATQGYNLTGDMNIVHSQWQVEYRVADPVRYLLGAKSSAGGEAGAGVRNLVRVCVVGAVMKNLAGMGIDEALTGRLSARILRDAQSSLKDSSGLSRFGIQLTALTNLASSAPGVTQKAFNKVTSALSEKKRIESSAHSKASEYRARAGAEANLVLREAEVFKRRMVASARSDAASLVKLLSKFPDDPRGLAVYLEQRRQDLIAEILEDANVYVIPEGQPGVLSIAPALEEQAKRKRGRR